MSTPEKRVKDKVKKIIKQYGDRVYANWPVPGGYGMPMLDCIGAVNGFAFAIETKANDTLTPRQAHTAQQMRLAGIQVFIIGETVDKEGNPSGLDIFTRWLAICISS